MYIIKDRLYLTEDRDRLVPDGDPEARFLFAVPGRKITDADAKRFGLADSDQAEPADGEEPKTVVFGGSDETVEAAEKAESEDAADAQHAPAPEAADDTSSEGSDEPVTSLIEPESTRAKVSRRKKKRS